MKNRVVDSYKGLDLDSLEHPQVLVHFRGEDIYVDIGLDEVLLNLWNNGIITYWSCIGDAYDNYDGFYINFNQEIGLGYDFYNYLKQNKVFVFDGYKWGVSVRISRDVDLSVEEFDTLVIQYLLDYKAYWLYT